MKKVILTLSVVGLMTACSSSTQNEVPEIDSTAVVADTVVVGTPDSVAVDSVAVDSVACCKK